jgi:hypothetical protein
VAASKRQTNYSSGKLATTAGNTTTNTTITTIQSVQIASRGRELQASGDADFYPTLSLTIGAAPMATVVHHDAENGTGEVAITHTLNNSHVVSHDASGSHQNIGSVTLVLGAKSTDGTTSPHVIAIGS